MREIDDAPAYTLDWLLAIQDVVNEAESSRTNEAGRPIQAQQQNMSGMREVRINRREMG